MRSPIQNMISRGAVILPALLLFSACSTHKYVASTHPNGKPEVVIYMKGEGEEAQKVMEKVYYPNGHLEYVGHFENGVESGEWVYYYESGVKKYVEHWEKGLEHGIQYDYSPDGQIYRELHYEHGKLVDTVDRTIPGYTLDQTVVDSTVVHPGYVPRPSDQRVNFALFFQDEMPRWPTFKVHVSLVFGTSLPYGPPNFDRYSDTLRTGLYRRVDIGFSKQLLGAPGQEKTNFMRHIKSMWVSLEVFNLINLNNTVDFTWVQDVSGRYYAIPEFLTPRRFNLKLITWF